MKPLTKIEKQLIVMGLVGIVSHAPPELYVSSNHVIFSVAVKLGLVDELRAAAQDFEQYSKFRAEESGGTGKRLD
jgi:hypothetical protein